MENAIWANQFDNLANRARSLRNHRREIWEQTDGKIDAWVAATGTGGTYAGVAMFLKDQNPQVRCAGGGSRWVAVYIVM
jgi:cysteine synthase A